MTVLSKPFVHQSSQPFGTLSGTHSSFKCHSLTVDIMFCSNKVAVKLQSRQKTLKIGVSCIPNFWDMLFQMALNTWQILVEFCSVSSEVT